MRELRWWLAGALAFLLVASSPTQSPAAWPPPKSATPTLLKDPGSWPNDPEYGYVASKSPSKRKRGQWQFYSFIPDRLPNAAPLPESETAAGMSIDMAWRLSIGQDSVLIAVLDSGIRWDEADLVEKAYLNKAELAAHLPLRADLSPCAPLDPKKPTEDLFDCNGDGILTVADYAEHPTLKPEKSSQGPKGDANLNGLLDAGDLIINFSDGKDDDSNGYVDDIAGWDFMKNDNDPYDDTRYGHGTGEAIDSVAQTNNGIGAAGVCPKCRFVPLRVGDSFIANAQKFAQAVLYATDNGASVIQEALGTINMSAFAQQSMDYAWKRGTLVVASMADENSRHHNMPATANHTLPVHAVTMLGSDEQSTTAKSFLAFNPCTNYGAQNFLSASGRGCSSEAVGRLSGIAGLVYSMARQSKLDPPLNANEALQLLTMTADDINIPESQGANPIHFWSQEGFDQRFGYGRVNANTALEWIEEGRIPPEVDITSPGWFETLYKDQLTTAVPILGTVQAKRALSYDVVVEWAGGVQPLDTEFKQIRSLTNIPSGEILGGDGSPLAELDVREIELNHERDVDSPLGENDRTITIRVRSVAHYGGAIGDVLGELRRAYAIHSDPDLVSGFPIHLGASGEGSPKLADIDGDGTRDIIVGTSDGLLNVFSLASGKPKPALGFPFRALHQDGLRAGESGSHLAAPAYQVDSEVDLELARESITAAPAIADVDKDGKPEIVFTTYEGTIYAINHDGSPVAGWPKRLPEVPSCAPGQEPTLDQPCMNTVYRLDRGAFASPVIEDIDGDGDHEIVQAAFDGNVYIFRADGSDFPGWPVRVHFPQGKEYGRILTTPTIADFNNDGTKDILVGSNERLGKGKTSGGFYIIDGKGTKLGKAPYLPNWPVTTVSLELFPLVAEGAPNSAAAADFNGDGKPEAVLHGNGSAPFIVPQDPGGQNSLSSTPKNALPERIDPDTGDPRRGLEPTSLFGPDSTAARPDTMFPLFAQPALGDLDQDGTPDLVTSGGSLSVAGALQSTQPLNTTVQFLLGMWNGKTGAMLPGSPAVLEDYTFFNNQAIADLNGDSYPEVLTGSGGYFVHAVDACGRQPEGWPKFTGQWVVATTAVGDISGDGKLEVVVGSREGFLYAWRTNGSSDGTIAWESFHHDNRNTGYLGTPLEQGAPLTASQPLALDSEGKCLSLDGPDKDRPIQLNAQGGCACKTSPSRRGSSGSLLSGLILLLAGLRRCTKLVRRPKAQSASQ